MKLARNVISRDQALTLAPAYVAFVEGEFGQTDVILSKFDGIRKGQRALSYHNGQFVLVTISSVNHTSFQAVDGPVVRVSNGEASWRVDGDKYAWPLS